MSKMLKMSILLMAIVLGVMLFAGTKVSAMEAISPELNGAGSLIPEITTIEITGAESLKETFKGKNASINGTTITLTGDVVLSDIIKISGADYVLNLNGKKLSVGEIYIDEGSLTINDEFWSGMLEVNSESRAINIYSDGKMIVNNGAINAKIINQGTLYINNGDFRKLIHNFFDYDYEKNVLNSLGKLDIKNGTFSGVMQEGIATITGGMFRDAGRDTALTISVFEDNKGAKTTISGGEFVTYSPEVFDAIAIIDTTSSLSEVEINKYIADGYEVTYDKATVITEYACPLVSYKEEVKVYPKILNDIIKKIAPDGKNAILKTVKPKNSEESYFILSHVVKAMLNDENYEVYAYCPTDDLSKLNVEIVGEGFSKSFDINVTYDEPKETSYVQSFVDKMKEFNEADEKSYYKVTDLGLINYYMTSSKSELWNEGAASRALRYSEDIIKISDGGNIKFELEAGAGEQADVLMYEKAFGEMTVFYDGYAYANKTQGLYLKRVIYIPQNTSETKEAYAIAAQERINEYLGKDNLVTVKYGGKLDEEFVDSLIQTEETDGNYYNITIKGKTYRFYIMKGALEQLKEPIYQGKDYNTNIEIKSADANVPLDTTVKAVNIKNDKVKKALGTENYEAYEISLYSDAKKTAIEKLENGKFEVTLPIPENLKDKELAVYYIPESGEKEEYTVTVKDNFAIFMTYHFSTYALAEKVNETQNEAKGEKDDTPKTGIENTIGYIIVTTIIVGVGVVTLKRKN